MKCMGAMVLRFQMKIHLMPDILFFLIYMLIIIYIQNMKMNPVKNIF